MNIRRLVFCFVLALGPLVSAEVEMANPRLKFQADPDKNQLTIQDFVTGRLWTARFDSCITSSALDEWQHCRDPKHGKFLLREAKLLDPLLIKLTVEDSGSGRTYFLDARLKPDGVTFELYADDWKMPVSCVGLPPFFSTPLAEGYLIFCDRSCGVLKSQTDFDGYAGWILDTYGNTSCLNMPWVGVFDREKGDGMMVLFETPLDSAMHLRKDQGRIWAQPLWKGTMGTLGYSRRVSLRFTEGGGYLALAEMYRNYQKEQGRFKTLEQKIAERPKVARLAGSPPVWGDNDVVKFLHEARNLGVTRAILGNAEREGRGRADMEELDHQGYLTLRYDSYSDILEGKTWFQKDDVQKTAYMLQPGGPLLKGWLTLDGLQYYSRSSSQALKAAQAYSKDLIEAPGFNAHFIDVMCAMDLMEDYHPEHSFSRARDMEFKRDVLKYYNDKSLVLGTEHGNDWAVDLVDYTEGSLSGSLWWTAGENKTGWNPGHLQRPKSLKDFSPLYLKYGVNPANRIPLWQLTYNDCVASTWYWGDSPGWFYEVAPEITEQKDLLTILYGALPLFWRDNYRGYDWSKNKERWMESYYLTVKFHEAVFGQQMTSHVFLTQDRNVQKTEFKNGGVAVVNFGTEPYATEWQGKKLVLPPNGFYAKAPGIEQGRLLRGGVPFTFVKSKDLLYCKSDVAGEGDEPPVAGKLVLFRLDENRWNLLFSPKDAGAGMDAGKLVSVSGWEAFDVRPLSSNWEMGEPLKVSDRGDVFLTAGAYALTKPGSTVRTH